MTHICVSKLIIIGSDNGLEPSRCQAIICTNAGILLIWPLGTNLREIYIKILTFSFKKMHLKVSSAKWRPFCFGLNVITAYGSTRLGQIYPPFEVYCQPTFLFSNIGWKAALNTSTPGAICSLRWHYQKDEFPIHIMYGRLSAILSQIAKGPVGPRWAQCWLHEPCYQGWYWCLRNPLAYMYIFNTDHKSGILQLLYSLSHVYMHGHCPTVRINIKDHYYSNWWQSIDMINPK